MVASHGTSSNPDSADDHVVPVQPAASSVPADFEVAYTRFYRDVYRYVLGLTRSIDETDDIVSEAFERALRAWAARDPAVDRELPWLLLTARRVFTDRWRRARRLAGLLPRVVRRPPDGAGEDRTEFWLWFSAVAQVLNDRQREVLLLRYQRDLTDADIGSIMGLSESGVRSLVGRALHALRSHPELLP